VRAAAVKDPDVLFVANEYQVKVPVPFVPGSEFAGVVAEVAQGVSHLAVGDRVFGTAMVGAFGEEITVAAESVRRTPDGVDDVAAAAFGVAHRTAYHVLKSVAAVQLGSILGASVTAVASSAEKLNLVLLKGVHLIGFQLRDFAAHAPD
jgi:NADPH:quinone reductase